MRNRGAIFFLALALPFAGVPARAAADEPLGPRYVKFLEDVEWIVTPEERGAFLSLGTDERRDAFIGHFWKARDPTPATEENELRAEHERRVQHADRVLGKGSRQRGSRTQRGRIHILLGKPLSIEREDGGKTWPIEMWFYQGLSMPGLPSSMYIVFFKPNERGEWSLYSPVSDGPTALLRSAQLRVTNNEIAVRLLAAADEELGRAALSLDASARPDFTSFTPAIDRVGPGLTELPARQADLRYVQPFLEGREDVEADYSFAYIPVRASIWVTRSGGRQFLAYALEVAPRDLSVAQYADRTSARLELDGTLSDAKGRIVGSIEDRLEFGLSAAEFQAVSARPLQISGRRPIVPGVYTLTLIVRNVVSRQYGRHEARLEVPEPGAWGPLLLAYRVGGSGGQDLADERPFDSLWARPSPWCGEELSAGAPVLVVAQAPEGVKQATVALEGPQGRREWAADVKDGLLVFEVPREALAAGAYRISVNGAASSRRGFTVQPGFWAEPWLASGKLVSAGGVEALLQEAELLERLGRGDQALERVRERFKRSEQPDPALRFGLASLCLRAGRFQEARDLLGPTVAELRYRTPQKGQGSELWFRLLAFAEAGAGDPAQAARTLGEALERSVPTPELLNQQARWFRAAKQTEPARQAYRRSLELEKDQPAILQELEGLH